MIFWRMMLEWARKNYVWLIPAILVAAYAAPLIGALLPDVSDELAESYEPAKTLVFFYSHGKQPHKWGPVPSFLYAPFYGTYLGYWYSKGEFRRPFNAIFTSLSHPFEQIGTMLLTARLIGLLAVLIGVALYARSLEKATRSRMTALAAVVLCVATAPDLIFSAVATKPDGMMMAFFAMSMAAYAEIVCDKFTPRRGMWLGLTAVASVSCKEATAPAYMAMFAWVLIAGLRERMSFFKDFARMVAIAVGFYLVLNVIYAPGAWVEHIRYWIGGPGKDPAIWAPPNQSKLAYLTDGLNGFLFNLGPGGVAAVLFALIASAFHWSRQVLGAWFPLAFYIVFVLVTAGNLPRYYMLPATVLAALPVALQIAALRDAQPVWQRTGVAILIAATILNLWAANMGWAQLRQVTPWMIERYAAKNLDKRESIHLANPWKVRQGATRLDYLGYRVDDRPLGELMKNPSEMPAVVLVSRDWEDWLRDFARRPARSRFYESTGYKYDKFYGIEALGYSLAETVHPDIPAFLEPPWLPWPVYRNPASRDLLVYRRNTAK